jgi:Fur family ferric uptake transcriptional regulator
MPHEPERKTFIQNLRDHGQRVTPERLALFDEIFEQNRHIDAEALLASLHSKGHRISRATVYRNLDLMVDSGLVRKVRLGQRRLLYEHVHPGQNHDHLVCRQCERVVEFVSPAISAMQREICRAHGFSPDHHQFQILGLCQSCLESSAEA